MSMQRLGINIFTHVLDDQEVVLKLIEKAFQEAGIKHFRLFSNEFEFLKSIDENVHIAVIDYVLESKEVNGLDVCKLLLTKNPQCLVIIMSGNQDPDVIIDFVNSGAWKYVRKWRSDYIFELVEYVKQGAIHISEDLDFWKKIFEKYKDKIDVPIASSNTGSDFAVPDR